MTMDFADLREIDAATLQPFSAAAGTGDSWSASDETKLANVTLGLRQSVCQFTKEAKRRHLTIVGRDKCAEHLGRLPVRGESVHSIFNGEISLWDFVGATLKLSGKPIDNLLIATLGFSAANCASLEGMLSAGQVKRVGILCSHFFSAQDAAIYQQMVQVANKHKFQVAAMRSHAKVMLLAVGKSRYVVESSANLRSCHNIEQATLFNSPEIYDFHETWITLFLKEAASGCANKGATDRELRDIMTKAFH